VAFAVRSGEKTRQVQMVRLDDLVPAGSSGWSIGITCGAPRRR
jgi:hypothetical protein